MKTRIFGFIVFLAVLIAWVVVCDGAAIPGTIVAAKITAGDTADTFSIGDTAEMGGTPKQVADVATRDAIPADRRTEGMTCWVINESNEYRLVGGILNANWALSQAMTNTPLNVFTNDGTYVHLYGTVMNVDAPYAFGKDGSFYQGTNATDGLTIAPGSMHVLGAVSFTDSNQPTSLFIDSAVDENTLNKNFANIHGQSSASPWIAAWSLTTGESAGSTNTLSLLSHTSDPPISWGVDATNRTQLDYAGMWHSQGYFDASGIPGQFVAYTALGRLVPTLDASPLTNVVNLSPGVSNYIATVGGNATNVVWPTQGTNVFLTTNGLAVKIDVPTQVITNIDIAYVTNIFVSTNYTTNLFVTYANITNLYVDVAYITNLYVSTNYTTNLIFNVAKGGTVYITNSLYSATNFFNETTVTNGITNLSLTANTVLKADGGNRIASIANGTGALTNNNAGVFGWYDNYLDKSGGTSTGPQLSTSASTNSPAANEFVTGNWVRGLLNSGFFMYAATNIQVGATNADSPNQFVYQFHSTIPQPAIRVWSTPFLTNNGYVGSVCSTQRFLSLAGGATVNSYMSMDSGGGKALSIKPEIYYSYDATNWLGDFDCQPQALTPGVTQLYAFAVSFPAVISTNTTGFFIERRLKVTSVGGSPTLTFHVGTNSITGTNNASHTTLNAASVNGAESVVAPGQSTTIRTNGLAYAVDVTGALSNNIITLGSNYFGGAVTGPTNSNNTTPDFSLTTGASLLVTNASFTFLTPINYDVTKKAQQWIEILVTNSTAADITITSPAGCATIGTAHCTNLTDVFVMYYPNVATNFYYIPCR